MKTVILFAAMVLLLSVAASAQVPATGITGKGLKLGLGFASINTDYQELDDFFDSRVGFSGGAFLTYSLSPQFAVQPEVLYVSKGAEKDLFFFTAYWSSDYIEVPVLLKFDLMPMGPAHPNLFAGPAMSFLLGSEIGALGVSYDVADGMKSTDFGVVFGAGIDYRRFTFDVRYDLGLSNTIDADKINSITGAVPSDFYYLEGDPSVKNKDVSFMLGFRF